MRFPTYPPDILSRADALLSEKYGTDNPIDPLLVEIACEAMMMEQERCAKIADEAIRQSVMDPLGALHGAGRIAAADSIAKAIRGTK